MARKRYNFVSGFISNNPLGEEDTVLISDGLSSLPTVTAPDYVVLVLDPLMSVGLRPEIVHVVAHEDGTNQATILRGREGSLSREHIIGIAWVHGLVVDDFDHSELKNLDQDTHQQYMPVDGARDFVATPKVNGYYVWHEGNMGSTSGLDADKLDGVEGQAYSRNYQHDQPVASAVWIIEHNLGRFPGVTVVDSAGSQVVGDIQYNNANTITITFSAAFAGKAHLD